MRRGRVQPHAQWTVSLIEDLTSWARREESWPDAPLYLFGHSAGGQFLSRVAAYAPPQGVKRFIIANPSTYVWPSLDEDAPYGLGGLFPPEEAEKRLRQYLEQPVTLFLGTKDTGSRNLTMTGAAKRQGKHRLARGENVFAAARALARSKGWTFNWRIVHAPGVGHSATHILNAPQAAKAFVLTGEGG